MKLTNTTQGIFAFCKGALVLKPGENDLTGEQIKLWDNIRPLKGVREKIADGLIIEPSGETKSEPKKIEPAKTEPTKSKSKSKSTRREAGEKESCEFNTDD